MSLLDVDVDLCADQERDESKERNPKLWAQESLSDNKRSWVSDHADFECAHEAHLDKSDDGFERSTAVDHAHTGQVGSDDDGRDEEVAREDLKQLCLAIGSASKVTLQRANQSVAQRRTDKEAISGQFESLVVTLDGV